MEYAIFADDLTRKNVMAEIKRTIEENVEKIAEILSKKEDASGDEKINRIILIGNGFDLAHGLKTGYKDFINNLCEQIKEYKSMWSATMAVDKPSDVDFSNTNFIEKESNFRNKFFQAIKSDLNIQNWVDVEKVYYKELVECLEDDLQSKKNKTKPEKSIKELNKDFSFIKKELEDYLSIEFGRWEKSDFNKPIPSIGSYLDETAETDKTEKYTETYIINFNYTSTDEIYDMKYTVIRLHGKLRNPKNPMIFGYGDELAKNYKELEELDNNDYLENVKSIKYSLTDNYDLLWDFVNSGKKYHIYLFGLSCGNADRTLLNVLFQNKNCEKIKIFFWQRPDMSDDYLEIYKNISRIFTDKDNLRTVVLRKPQSKPLVPIERDIFLKENFVSLNDNEHKFYISKFLVTQAQFESIMGYNPSYFRGEKLPVECVSWYEAATFCNLLSDKLIKNGKRYIEKKDGTYDVDDTQKGFRLPTDTEWKYAAEHCLLDETKETTKYAGTNDRNDLKNYAWYFENSGDKKVDEKEWYLDLLYKNNCRTHEVGTADNAKELRIHDLSGNVWEWCEDKCRWENEAVLDSSGARRVLRGGSCYDRAGRCSVSYRYCFSPGGRNYIIGFRLVLPQ